MTSAAPIGFTLTNPALKAPVIEVGVAASLDIVLTNDTGADIGIQSSPASTLTIFATPSPCFTAAELQAMSIDLEGWSLSVDTTYLALVLTAKADGTWAAGESIRFTIENVESEEPPGSKSLQINPANLTGQVPLSVSAPLIVKAPPKPGNASLADVLQANLANQGAIYRSNVGDPLQNSLFLNLKNTAAVPLYSGKSPAGQPQVSVTFVYGNTSGALAPDTNHGGTAPKGSAWNIVANPKVVPLAWSATNPDVTGGAPHPQWTLEPASLQVLGTGDAANATFEFSNVLSFTPVGHTQMYLLFTGFMKDEKTAYDDRVFVLDIVKQDPPATRGLLSFQAKEPVVEVREPGQVVPLDLRWAMFEVAKVQLLTSSPAIPPKEVPYPTPQPLAYDEATITLPPIDESQPLFMSLQSYDGNGGFLNALQFTVYAQVSFVKDKGGRCYPVALFGDTFWMVENLAYDAHASYGYGNPTLDQQFGRLYEWSAAMASAPEGWSLPTQADWNDLLNAFASPEQAYQQLIAGGDSGFDAMLGGTRDNQGSIAGLQVQGVYWTATEPITAQFASRSGTLSVGSALPPGFAASVRYVRRA